MELRKEKLTSTRASIRNILLQRREVLAGGLRQATHDLIEDEAFYSDTVDQASADAAKSFALALKNRERDTLWQIDEALKRIDSGEFGECERCGEEIAEARIRAFPLTTLCIDCKSELESEQRRSPGRD
jgi:DnaK suppressor protein